MNEKEINDENVEEKVEETNAETIDKPHIGVDLSPEATDESNEEENHDDINMNIDQLDNIMANLRNTVIMMEDSWKDTQREFKLTDEHMKQLYQYNEQNRVQPPENATDEEKENFDHFNGLDNIPEDTIYEIFGEGHPIIGVDITQTRDRIKDSTAEFFNYLSALREYKNVEKAYMEYIEINEEQEMNKLKVIAENTEDEEMRQKMLDSLNDYYKNKYLEFLLDDNDVDKERLIQAYGDPKKIEYWLQRTRDKLYSMKINQKFILEISQFEKRYLPEKYHCVSNLLLLRFMNLVTFANTNDPKDKERTRAIMMVNALDNIVNDVATPEVREKTLNNIMEFLDMYIEPLAERYPNDVKPIVSDNTESEE